MKHPNETMDIFITDRITNSSYHRPKNDNKKILITIFNLFFSLMLLVFA